LIVLALLAEKPRHGYEIIKALEEHSSGIYTPSPGVVYPALTYLEEMNFATSESEGNKKRYQITSEGTSHLEKNRALVDETLEQLGRFGNKMARMKKHFEDEEAENDFDHVKDWRHIKLEFRELKEELKSALREKMDSSAEEKKRILGILRKAIDEIRGKS
jgi:DNA-binding PadR family transcriptional regulator